LAAIPPERWVVEVAGKQIVGVIRTYAERPTGALTALVGSTGWVEVAVVDGDAGRQLSAGAGATVRLRRMT
jgi:S-adenosylmethionine hydrolase